MINLKNDYFTALLRNVIQSRPKQSGKLSVISKSEAIIKLNTYLAEPVVPFDTDIFVYWEKYSFEMLQNTAYKFLITPATSTASERTFSAGEYTITKRRNRLHPDKVKELIILNKNFNFIDDL